MHKEGITELHYFLQGYPHKKTKVEKCLSRRVLHSASISHVPCQRAAEDEEREVAVADTLSSEFLPS